MTKTQIVKNNKIDLKKFYNKLKNKLIEDNFHVTSDVQTDFVYHLRAEKTSVSKIIIGAIKDIELIIAGEQNSFAIMFSVGAWGKNMVTSASTGYIITSILAGPAVFYGGMAATSSFVRAVAYEQDFWRYINQEIERRKEK